MDTPTQEATKLGSNAIKDIGKKEGPWAVLFLLLAIAALFYVLYEKHECNQEKQQLTSELNTLKKDYATLQINLANCETMMKYLEAYAYKQPQKRR
jgi:hypothetical protein